MVNRPVKNVEASIRNRLLNISKKTGENYNAILLRFFQERFLARLGSSAYREHFVLKGGVLLLIRSITPFRPTMDIDMLGLAISNDPKQLEIVIQEIGCLELNDGVLFDMDTITNSVIKEDDAYQGLRFIFGVRLGKMRTRMQLDIAFGDFVPLTFIKDSLPPLLPDLTSPELLIYPLESVISEKFQSIVYLERASSRMKDFYDILFLAENNMFTLEKLKLAMKATFEHRETDIESRFNIYKPEYIKEKDKQWKPFLKKIGGKEPVEFSEIIYRIKSFLEPVLKAGIDEYDLKWDSNTWKWRN